MFKSTPNFKYETELWDRGYKYVIGADEVGKGSFAGPVFAACVGFPSDAVIPASITINDSKVLTQKARESAYLWIKENMVFGGVGSANVREIEQIGIVGATNRAFRRAVINAENKSEDNIEHLLIDGFSIPYMKGFPKKKQSPIIKGDSLSFSIAAASIIAKVTRDGYMTQLSKQKGFGRYKWNQNKGYGTKEHREAIIKHGLTKHHRKRFVKKLINK